MEKIKCIAMALICIFFFFACQKEITDENPPIVVKHETIAEGSLKTLTGNCHAITINGTYKQDSTLTDSNYIMVQVYFSSPGLYNIGTETKNGFSFRDSAYIIDTGFQRIKLKGTGKPLIVQLTDFVISFNGGFCNFSIPVAGTIVDSSATYSLEGSPNACSNYNVQGTYISGTALSTANKIALQVKVDKIGGYSLTTVAKNGMTFTSTGKFTNTGVQMIILQGTGTPTATGTTSVPITAGSSNCSFDIIVKAPQAPSDKATFILGSCAKTAVKGTYYAGVAVTDNHTVTVEVNVTVKGTYTIKTEIVNGLSAQATGTFVNTGVQNVVLRATGTPVNKGSTTIPITVGSNDCTALINVTESPEVVVNLGPNSWCFKEGSNIYTGAITWRVMAGDSITNSSLELRGGSSGNNSDTSFFLHIQMPDSATRPVLGTYHTDPRTTSKNTTSFLLAKGTGAAQQPLYYVKSKTGSAVTTKIVITSYDPITKVVKGTFSGTSWNKSGAVVNIANGQFNALVN